MHFPIGRQWEESEDEHDDDTGLLETTTKLIRKVPSFSAEHHARKSRYVSEFIFMHLTDNLSWAGSVDALVAARAELARLQQEELRLLKQLFGVHNAANAQRIKIDALVRERNRTISCLPMELLVKIFVFCICPDSLEEGIYRRMQQLAGVSRHWRDVVLHSPTFWTCIIISPSVPSLKTRLERSGQMLLDIKITGWSNVPIKATLMESLQIIIPCANRWRSLILDENSLSFTTSVIDAITHLEFPFFQRVCINVKIGGHPNYWPFVPPPSVPGFLSLKSSPALEHLTLGHFGVLPGFPTQTKLKTLELKSVTLGSLSPVVLFSQSLTKLSLSGTMRWLLEPDSIPFPVLRTLILSIDDPKKLLEAILAPMLQYFNYSHRTVRDPDHVVFGRVKNKFDAVHLLTFALRDVSHRLDDTCGVALCQAFPSVRYLSINAHDIGRIFAPRQQSGSPRFFMGDCNSLEQVTIFCSNTMSWTLNSTNTLVQWLTNRIDLGQRRLHVKFLGTFPPITKAGFVVICYRLRQCCILEVDNVLVTPPVRLIYMSGHSPLEVASTSSSKIGIANSLSL